MYILASYNQIETSQLAPVSEYNRRTEPDCFKLNCKTGIIKVYLISKKEQLDICHLFFKIISRSHLIQILNASNLRNVDLLLLLLLTLFEQCSFGM